MTSRSTEQWWTDAAGYQVAAKLGAYSDVGIDAFILSGYSHIAECDLFGRLVLETMPHRKLWQP